ncbi:hypothetical protein A3H81_01560 [Candidatus Daviesbacteria bacterium RIFCSPLOWO2_02_FULL_38_18]|nr:MAG: hypothetical protein A3H81_01560 [Candidatus Daviesbacteria bacterium RIFCSPLOWO2_02_FULL_38_18]OGE73330.1 MAG: hypothetical protein A3H18_04700 [Candidatus Daviesbacteria bacterium RIFCSPLOWO2_12_FULL_38_10]HCB22823.1 hypothetical protein [Candidatus Daviesbacteria bacterium]
MVKKITKLLFIFTASFPVLFFLNTGFSTDLLWKTFQTIVFSVLFSLSLVWPVLKKYFLILSGLLLIFMAVFFISGQSGWAEIFGSSGFGLVLLLLISYVPQLIKKGYIEHI